MDDLDNQMITESEPSLSLDAADEKANQPCQLDDLTSTTATKSSANDEDEDSSDINLVDDDDDDKGVDVKRIGTRKATQPSNITAPKSSASVIFKNHNKRVITPPDETDPNLNVATATATATATTLQTILDIEIGIFDHMMSFLNSVDRRNLAAANHRMLKIVETRYEREIDALASKYGVDMQQWLQGIRDEVEKEARYPTMGPSKKDIPLFTSR